MPDFRLEVLQIENEALEEAMTILNAFRTDVALNDLYRARLEAERVERGRQEVLEETLAELRRVMAAEERARAAEERERAAKEAALAAKEAERAAKEAERAAKEAALAELAALRAALGREPKG